MNDISRAVAAALMLSSAAMARHLPHDDVPERCTQIADGGAKLTNVCRRAEQAATDQLQPIWALVPEATRTRCDHIARGSSRLLAAGIHGGLEAAADNEVFTFQRCCRGRASQQLCLFS